MALSIQGRGPHAPLLHMLFDIGDVVNHGQKCYRDFRKSSLIGEGFGLRFALESESTVLIEPPGDRLHSIVVGWQTTKAA
jgi:hypothetical protein